MFSPVGAQQNPSPQPHADLVESHGPYGDGAMFGAAGENAVSRAFEEVAAGLTGLPSSSSLRRGLLVHFPGASAPVRFNEREAEPEQGWAGGAPADQRAENR